MVVASAVMMVSVVAVMLIMEVSLEVGGRDGSVDRNGVGGWVVTVLVVGGGEAGRGFDGGGADYIGDGF